MRRLPEVDRRVVAAARSRYPDETLASLTSERLRELTAEAGCDIATALFYAAILDDPSHRAFVARVDGLAATQVPTRCPWGRLLLAPAAFFEELPRFGGDGRTLCDAAARLGLDVALLPVSSTGSVAENAATIRGALERESADPLFVVSLSKGAADVYEALRGQGGRFPNLRAWVQICGLVRGSPFIDAILTSPVRRSLLRGYLWWLGADLSICADLGRSTRTLDADAYPAPEGVEVISVVGVPLARHMRGNARRRYLQMRRLGPNDGSGLLRDAVLEPGRIYPVWGADHYFRVPEVPALVERLVAYLAWRWA